LKGMCIETFRLVEVGIDARIRRYCQTYGSGCVIYVGSGVSPCASNK
jgi:hypothetical protein